MTMIWGTRRSDCKRSYLTVALAAALGGGVVLGVMPQVAVAQQATQQQQYDIPAQALGSALNQLAIQSGEEIMVQPDLVRGLQAPQLQGRYGFDQAITRLLEGSGLSWRRNKRGLVTVVKSPAAAPARTRAPRASRTAEESPPVHNMAEILVKGSRSLNADIRRTIDDPQPYVVFEREEIERSGAINLSDFMLRRLSANTSNAPPTQTGGLVGEVSRINLRGLGDGQTLILIDGRRAAPSYFGSTPGQPNLNGVPLSAVERIEVLPTTASAIYGGSATGGVINIILRRDYQGGEVAVSHDNSFDTDSSINRVDLSYGFNLGSRTTALLNGSYSESNLLLKRDRDFRKTALERLARTDPSFLALSLYHQSTSPNIGSTNGSNLSLIDGTPLNSPITHAPQGYLGPQSDGAAALFANAGRINTDNDYNASFVNGGSAFGTASQNKSLSASFRHHFNDRFDGFLDLSTSKVESSSPSGSSASFTLPAGHQFNPFLQAIRVSVPVVEFNDVMNQRNDSDRVSTGLIARLGEDWAGSLDYTWSRSRNFYSRQIYSINSAAALADGFNPLIDYYNLGGRSLRPYLSIEGRSFYGPSAVYSYSPTLRFSGPLWRLPAGQVSASFLLEENRTEFAPRTTHYYSGSQSEYLHLNPDKHQRVRSAYAELSVPLIGEANSRAGVRFLDLQFAGRYDDYDTLGSNGVSWYPGEERPEPLMVGNSVAETTGVVGVRFSPLSGMTFRASHGTGFVPPDIGQLGAPTVVDDYLSITLFDPRRGNSVNPHSYTYVGGGNPSLDPEYSKTTSLGVIVEPVQLPGLRASLDYTRLEKTDNVTTLTPALLLEYEVMFPDRVRRGPNLPTDEPGWAGPITYLDVSRINAAASRYESLDLQLKYSFDLSDGVYMELWGNGTWTLKAEQQTVPGGPLNNLRGVTSSYGAVAPLNFRGFYGMNVEAMSWSAGWTTQHYSSYLVANPELAGSARILAAQGNGGRVPRQLVHNVWGRWQLPQTIFRGVEVSGGVRNVFNTKPEMDLSNDYQFYSYLVDPRLRTYYLQLKYAF